MTSNLEIEVKALLSLKEFNKFIRYFSKHKFTQYTQINYYIDNSNFLIRNHKLSLRIRKKLNKYELTLKKNHHKGRLEENEFINEKAFNEFINQHKFPQGIIKKELVKLGIDVEKLNIITSLSTTRMDIKYKGGLLSLDKNKYSNKIDYEIEFEYKDKRDAKKILKRLFNELDITFIENKTSKVARAFSMIYK